MPNRNLISLFAGAGGLDLGLEMAGFTTRVANELEPHACETLRRNREIAGAEGKQLEAFIADALNQRCYKGLDDVERAKLFARMRNKTVSNCLKEAEIIEGDIRDVPSSTFEKLLNGNELFCIAGGPPCQPFSKAGKQKSLDCTKNGDLFFEFVRLINDLKPKWFVFENVKGLTFTKTDVVYIACKKCGEQTVAPFRVRQNFQGGDTRLLPCPKCGNKRTGWNVISERGGSLKIILNEFRSTGYACDTAVLNAADFGAPQIRERLFIVGSIDGKRIDWPNPTHAKVMPTAKGQGDLFSDSKVKPWVSIGEALWSAGHPTYGRLKKATARLWVKNVVRPHDEPVTWPLNRPAPTIGAHQGPKLAIAPNGVPEEQLFRQQWHTLGRRQGDTAPVFVEHCYLSDEELLALQTFPRWWYLHGTRMQRAFQIGNAVPPILGKAIGDAILKAENLR